MDCSGKQFLFGIGSGMPEEEPTASCMQPNEVATKYKQLSDCRENGLPPQRVKRRRRYYEHRRLSSVLQSRRVQKLRVQLSWSFGRRLGSIVTSVPSGTPGTVSKRNCFPEESMASAAAAEAAAEVGRGWPRGVSHRFSVAIHGIRRGDRGSGVGGGEGEG